MDLPASPDSPQTTIESYAGFYRKGFEQSHFYSSTGGLPYWLIADGSVADKIESFVVERPGRGSGVTVALDLNAWIDPDTEDLDHMGNFRGKLHVVSINTIRQISGEEFELVVSKIGPKE